MRETRDLIKNAFAKVPRPRAPRDIAPHDCAECDRIAKDLKDYSAAELPREVVEYHCDSLPLLGPQALKHYLPAWLLYSLDHPESDVMMYTVFHLTPSRKNTTGKENFEERFGQFTQEEREAIAAFFDEVRYFQLYDGTEGELERANELWSNKA